MSQDKPSTFPVILTSRDHASAESRARTEEVFIRNINSFITAMARREPDYLRTMPASYIEYLCQLAYEGPASENMAARSKTLADAIGTTNIQTLRKLVKGFISTLNNKTYTPEPVIRKNMTREILLYHVNKVRHGKHTGAINGFFRRRAFPYVDDTTFGIIIPRQSVRNIAWDSETSTSRFRCKEFSDTIKVVGIDLTKGGTWKHLRLQAEKTWLSEITGWNIIPKMTNYQYVRLTK